MSFWVKGSFLIVVLLPHPALLLMKELMSCNGDSVSVCSGAL